MELDFADILLEVIESGASDLHLTVGAPPMVRERGRLRALDRPALNGQETREIVYSILNNDQRKRLENDWQIDLSYAIPGKARFRVNAYFQRASIGAVLRAIPTDIPPFGSLGLPEILKDFTRKPRGFVLVTGPTGSGKSTTLASMIDMINEERHEHIMTVEDPIEFLHRHKSCVVNQRELGSDAKSFAAALKSALRQDPDVILVGEMRDLETMATALTAAETGHLVFATLHTQDASQTVDRIVDSFPPEQQHQVRSQLAIALQGIVTQQLLPTVDGRGRVCACEVLVPTPAVRNLIREGKTHQLYSALQTGGAHGMQTMDAALVDLIRGGAITTQLAESRSSSPEELRRLMEGVAPSGASLSGSAVGLNSRIPAGGGIGGPGGGIGGPGGGNVRPGRGI
ncbi:MAG: type IV pilus twitching motility protein PilT [Thermoleophilaceae bacterium]